MDGDELWNEKTLTGIKVPSSEQKAAIYLGFTHICSFRAYLSSRSFLQLYWNQTNRYLKLAYDNDFLGGLSRCSRGLDGKIPYADFNVWK